MNTFDIVTSTKLLELFPVEYIDVWCCPLPINDESRCIFVVVSEADKSHQILPPHPENSTVVVGRTASFLCHVHSSNEQHPNIQVDNSSVKITD